MDKDLEFSTNLHNFFVSNENIHDLNIHSSSSGFFIHSALMNQVNNRIIFNRELGNLLKTIKERYNSLAEIHTDDSGYLERLFDKRKELYVSLFNLMSDAYGIKYSNEIEELNWEDLENDVKHLYYFFVLNYKENIISLFMNVIKERETQLAKALFTDRTLDKKDLVTTGSKSSSKNKMMIVNNLERVLKMVTEEYHHGLDIITDIVEFDKDELNFIKINEMFLDSEDYFVDGNFAEKYFETFLEYDEIGSILGEITGKILE